MTSQLATVTSADWSLAEFRDSVLTHLKSDRDGHDVLLFFYAATEPGWKELRAAFRKWLKRTPSRSVVAYIGTDHGLTEPEALRRMIGDAVDVRLMADYRGVFHPKVIWLRSPNAHCLWTGSNNLTRDGLRNNIEFASLLRFPDVPASLQCWAAEVHAGSIEASEAVIADYERERRQFGVQRAALGNFTWSRRETTQQSPHPLVAPRSRARHSPSFDPSTGDLVIEIMPKETGQDGKQIQLPIAVLKPFFGLRQTVGASRTITITPTWIRDPRELTLTVFKNHTARLVIRELDYRDRPCLIVIRKDSMDHFRFDVVSRAVAPRQYRSLLNQCGPPTRSGSRRWTILR